MAEGRLHPRNEGFAWTPAAGPYRVLDEEQAGRWDADGYFLLENAFDAELLNQLTREIDPLEERAAAFLRTRPDGKLFISEEGNITFFPHAVLRSAVARAFVAHPVFQNLASDLIGPDVRLYWDQAVYKKPEKPKEFPWHQDNGYTYVEPQQYLTCWVPLVDATVDNGCPWVVPGAHLRGTLDHWMTDAGWRCLGEPEGAVPVEAPAGSVVVFSSLTPHRTGPNTSDGIRKAYIVQFAPDGAAMRKDDDPPISQDDPDRQFLILRGGEPVEAPPLRS